MMAGKKPNFLLPTNRNTPTGKKFWEGVRQRKLLANKCGSCGEVLFPPRPCCPKCLADDPGWVELSGKGTLHSWTEVCSHGPAFDAPFLLGLVDLAEGVGRVASKILGAEAGDLKIGMPVRLEYVDVSDDFTLYCITPDNA